MILCRSGLDFFASFFDSDSHQATRIRRVFSRCSISSRESAFASLQSDSLGYVRQAGTLYHL
jgi:hypothetical protein